MNTTIGENIKTMRHKCGFTQEELALRLGVTPQAISKWENGGGTPDISQLIPLSQIFGITTDSLLGVVSATYGSAHTEATLGHEKLLMSTSASAAEKHLAAYTYFRAESEKEPTNYTIMRKCISHGAEISRHTDFHGFLSDKPELRDEIFADCERKNLCIARYCEDRVNVEKSDNAMIWIYIHTKEWDKAKKLIDRLPSLESNNLKESIMTQYLRFQFGFDKARDYIIGNVEKLLNVTGKEFFYSFEDFAWFTDSNEALEYGAKVLTIIDAYKAFDHLVPAVLKYENLIRSFLPRCYAAIGDIDKAANELITIANNGVAIAAANDNPGSIEETKADTLKDLNNAVTAVDKSLRDKVMAHSDYKKAVQIIENID